MSDGFPGWLPISMELCWVLACYGTTSVANLLMFAVLGALDQVARAGMEKCKTCSMLALRLCFLVFAWHFQCLVLMLHVAGTDSLLKSYQQGRLPATVAC